LGGFSLSFLCGLFSFVFFDSRLLFGLFLGEGSGNSSFDGLFFLFCRFLHELSSNLFVSLLSGS
jgi:hypothetical protein